LTRLIVAVQSRDETDGVKAPTSKWENQLVKSCASLPSLLAPAIGIFILTAGAQAQQSQSNDLNDADRLCQEKVQRPVANLRDRVLTILEVQIAVHEGTVGLHKRSNHAGGQKLQAKDQQVLLKLLQKEKELVVEATRLIGILKTEEAAVAFLEFFRQFRDDTKRVQRRLTRGDVGIDTQAIEQDIIDSLKEMVRSLKSG
jgi:hypothetical protein